MARRSGSILGVIFGVLAIAGCAAPAPSPSPSPTPLELGDGPPTASAESNGIALDLWLDHTDITVGDTVLALVRLTNSSDAPVFRETNVCDIAPATTVVTQNEARDAVPFGIDWPDRAEVFKRQLLTDAGLGKKRELGRFGDISLLGGALDCVHRGRPDLPFAPSSADDLHLTWLAVPRDGSVLVPGPAVVHSAFSTSTFEATSSLGYKVAVDVDVRIAAAPGADANPVGLTLVDYVDAALSVAQFRDWIDNAGSGLFFTPSYTFTATTVEIRATMPTSGDTDPESHSVVVNRASGIVMSFK
jgi:hypothetical protein